MKTTRKIRKVIQSRPTIEGAGVHLKRVFGFSEVPALDPFLLLDDFRIDEPEHYLMGFPWHPHRGIETITYMLTGSAEHQDSLGHRGVIGPGDVQWMTAGSGIIHQEMPKGDATGRMGGFQLWANLPASHKMMGPRYRDIKRQQIPEVALDNGTMIKVICGTAGKTQGSVRDIITDPEYLDVKLPAHTEFSHPTRWGYTVCAYMIEGQACFCPKQVPFSSEIEAVKYTDLKRSALAGNAELVLFADGDQVTISTEDEPARFLLLSGKPLGEPVAWYGPIVMNTQAELQTAFEEYNNGTFIKHEQTKG